LPEVEHGYWRLHHSNGGINGVFDCTHGFDVTGNTLMKCTGDHKWKSDTGDSKLPRCDKTEHWAGKSANFVTDVYVLLSNYTRV